MAARDQRAEVRAHRRHRGGRQDQPARHVLPDERQLLLRRLLQGRRDPARLGAADRAARREGGYGLDPERIWATVYLDDDEAVAALARADRHPDRADRAPREGRQLLVHGRARPRRPVQRDLLRPRPGVRPRGRPGGRRGPLHGVLEPRLHAVRAAARAAPRRTSTILGDLPAKNIDTGMGLERIASLLQGVDNLYEIDEVYPVLERGGRADRQALRRQLRARRGAQSTPTTSGCGSSPTTCAPR